MKHTHDQSEGTKMDHLVAHLAHVEILTPRLQESVAFFHDLVGMEVVLEHGDSVFLRTWGNYLPYDLILTQSPATGLGHIGWRAKSAEALDLAARRLGADNGGLGWQESAPWQGKAYLFVGPNGQKQKIFWEAEHYQAPQHLASPLPTRPQRTPARGVAARHLDHVNFPSADVLGDAQWYERNLGVFLTEWTEVPGEGLAIFATLSTGSAFQLAFLRDDSGHRGRFHHFALQVDERADVIRAAEIFREAGILIEWGPGRHGHGESFSVYVREPGGMRLEIVSPGLQRIAPDHKPVKWAPTQGSADFYLSNPLPEAFLEVLPAISTADQPASAIDVAGLGNPWGNA
ncbi:VOC family protein [Streptomyces sp. NPDC059278]|uniref:VOC family protein n=1 Tax=Streptomyces sp. NPDC059278 TaxID=3346801 RepID=UPI0036A2BB36